MKALRIAAALGLLAVPVAHAAPSTAGHNLVELRMAVEDLSRTLTERRATHRDELAALRAEKAELQRQIRLARVRASTLGRIERDDAEREEVLDAEANAWVEPARRALESARAHVDASLPFALEHRRSALDRIARDLSGAQPDVARAMERLWRILEEEAAMGREVGLRRQAVELGDGQQLAEVLRLSMAVMYVRTSAGQIAWARHGPEGWRLETIEDQRARAVVERLFVAQEKNEGFGPTELLVPLDIETREVVDAQ